LWQFATTYARRVIWTSPAGHLGDVAASPAPTLAQETETRDEVAKAGAATLPDIRRLIPLTLAAA